MAMCVMVATCPPLGTTSVIEIVSCHVDSCLYQGQVSLDFVQPANVLRRYPKDVTGTWNSCRAPITAILEGGRGGSIVFIGSTAAIQPLPTMGHYAAAAFGLVGLLKAWHSNSPMTASESTPSTPAGPVPT